VHGPAARSHEACREALDAERRAPVVEQQRLEALPGAQALGGAGARVEAGQRGGGVVDVKGMSFGVAQHDADAHALTSARRRRGHRLIVAVFSCHGPSQYRPAVPPTKEFREYCAARRRSVRREADVAAPRPRCRARLTEHGARPAEPGSAVYCLIMTTTVPDAFDELDSLRERLRGASERLSWLRSYL
jgi:hypothetical protein